MFRKYGVFIPFALIFLGFVVWAIGKQYREPLSQRRADILAYVKQHDGIGAVVLGHTHYANGGTAWSLQPVGDKYESFTVVDNGYFRTNIVRDDYKDLSTRP